MAQGDSSMVLSITRENTTKFAIKKINELIDRDDVKSALLLASIYVHMRLKTLITMRLDPPKEHWRDISNSFNSGNSTFGYGTLVKVCNKLGLVESEDKKQLLKLWDFRNDIAHETELWKDITKKEEKDIVQLCEFSIKFLKKTNN